MNTDQKSEVSEREARGKSEALRAKGEARVIYHLTFSIFHFPFSIEARKARN
jgi:hypothetical protein